jgi:teichuronic acid biosynthesis glycosyltransferase TuaC
MTSTPRITFFSTVHPHPWSPTKGAFNAAMLRGLVREGAHVRAVVPVPWTERRGVPTGVDPGYPVTFVPFWYLPRVAPLALATQLYWSSRGRLQLAASQSDILLGYWTDPDGTVLSRVAASHKVPYVQMVGGSDVLLLAGDARRGQRIRDTLHRADRVITIGENLRNTLMANGIAPDRIESYRRGVDRGRFAPGDMAAARERLQLPGERPILLWVGRMVPVKGLDVLLAAMARPELQASAPLLVLVGDGPLRATLERQARETLPAGAVRFVGNVPHHELASWYQAADLMVLPSRSEGVPNVLLEGLACGTGFVASDVGSVRELATDPARQLVPAGDPAALASCLASSLIYQVGGPTHARLDVPDSLASARALLSILQQVRR